MFVEVLTCSVCAGISVVLGCVCKGFDMFCGVFVEAVMCSVVCLWRL